MKIAIKIILRTLTCFVLLAPFIEATAQSLSFEQVSSQKWLYQRNISCLTQDKQGYIWFGTNNGVYRFDGYTVKEYRREAHNINSLIHNNVNCIYAGKDGFIWIGTWGGLTKFDPSMQSFTHYKHDPKNLKSISNNDIRAIE